MSLLMKESCERCGGATARDAGAYICIYECTFCTECTNAMNAVCPNCGGELVRRPRARGASVETQSGSACAIASEQ